MGLTHYEVKQLCKTVYNIRLTCLPFEAFNENDIKRGDVLMVADVKTNSAPYRNPRTINYDEIVNEQNTFAGPFYDPLITREEYEDEIDSYLTDPREFEAKVKTIGTRYNLN